MASDVDESDEEEVKANGRDEANPTWMSNLSRDTAETLAALVATLQGSATPPQPAYDRRRQEKPCSHCGSTRHVDRDCWRRLTCSACDRKGHPAEHCYQICKGCGKVHDKGACELEEIVNQIKAWYDPTKHAGLLPPTLEKSLN
jgi:hypothetical protein